MDGFGIDLALLMLLLGAAVGLAAGYVVFRRRGAGLEEDFDAVSARLSEVTRTVCSGRRRTPAFVYTEPGAW